MDTPLRRRPRSLALELVEALAERIRRGEWAPGDRLPTEASVMSEFGVSRTVVREAISKLQASGLVETRHGVGTFVLDSLAGASFKLSADQLGTLQDVIAVLELRIGLETEAAALAAVRRTDGNLATMRQALDTIAATLQTGENAVASDFQFHSEIARATQNAHFFDLMLTLGSQIIPRARLSVDAAERASELAYLRRVQAEHESIYDAIAAGDAEAARAAMRMHLSNSRERRRRSQAS